MQATNPRVLVFNNIVGALVERFGDVVQPDVDVLNNSYLVYINNVTVEVTFDEDKG